MGIADIVVIQAEVPLIKAVEVSLPGLRGPRGYPGTFSEYTWATRPTAIGATEVILITDVGVAGGALFFSNNVEWRPIFPVIIAQGTEEIPNTNSTDNAEFNLASVAVPGGLIGLKGGLHIRALYSFTGSTNSKSITIRHNTTSVAISGGNKTTDQDTTSSSNRSCRVDAIIRNRNNAAVQIFGSGSLSINLGFSGVVQTGAIDTASTSYINFNGKKALGTESLSLEAYDVTIIP